MYDIEKIRALVKCLNEAASIVDAIVKDIAIELEKEKEKEKEE